ncbi:hypothetical protein OG585_54640 (plasmid) [Streptomyces sp. NBC_01340]|uniref:hypothetical protein n=1 Tax=unclassified Streptomyces TaxID=2593676 RepID=UPI002252898B|nr:MULTISPECIES: hypothetical protein [unclassified Streptomyces]MCX4462364.1 hypothetical protein [Streptomyces sp. NBC_01719]MCX4499434.1 hypothetical protein [Streptomyces sp. NBC_01728]MCX4500597.1 hypothetical protein [Streptomyces sp. NBC_01728]MCX4500802.1 hypothetical protein [Streptomyces sp. NBC_01728]MCX4594663.1 hypothetical protein [Streptomyces sp. NBC_01549]
MKVFTGASETCCGIRCASWREAHAGLMDVGTWLDRSGRARLTARLDCLPV